MEKQEWTEKVMNSLDGLSSVPVEEGLFQQLMERIEKKPRLIPLYLLAGMAASFLLLIALNIAILKGPTHQSNEEQRSSLFMSLEENNYLYTH